MMKHKQTQQGTQLHSAAHEELQSPQETTGQNAGSRRVYRCVNCDIEFFWKPTVVQGNVYCCSGCAAGGPCTCDYSLYRSVIIMGVIYYDQ